MLYLAVGLAFAQHCHAQDAGCAATGFFGKGVAISVVVHDPSGEPLSSSAIVKLFRGTIPSGQTQTIHGRAEFVANDLGEFTVVVDAPGYATAQKDFSITANGRAEIDVSLRASSANPTAVPGRPLLAPKAQKAVDAGLHALASDKLTDAQKHVAEAIRLVPAHPDVLYLQGVLFLKQRDWPNAPAILLRATQLDPSYSNAFAALGMALCNEGKYEAAIAPLERLCSLTPRALPVIRDGLWRKPITSRRNTTTRSPCRRQLCHHRMERRPRFNCWSRNRYEDAAQALRNFLQNHSDRRAAATAGRWLNGLASNGKLHPD